jgi:hypothetical protein
MGNRYANGCSNRARCREPTFFRGVEGLVDDGHDSLTPLVGQPFRFAKSQRGNRLRSPNACDQFRCARLARRGAKRPLQESARNVRG